MGSNEAISYPAESTVESNDPHHGVSAASNTSSGTDFDYIAQEYTQLGDIGKLFADVLKVSSALTPEQKAKHFIDEVDRLASTSTQTQDSLGYFSWQFGEQIVGIAARIPPRNLAQAILVGIVASLFGADKNNEVYKWKSLDDFAISVREAWNRVPSDSVEPNPSEFTGSQWVNLNSFIAKLYGKRITQWANFPIWEFRDGLETPLTPPISDGGSIVDVRMRVVREWLGEAAPRLLQDSLLSTFSDYPEGGNRGRPYRGGPLYTGESCFSLERWCFWKRRLKEIRADVAEDVGIVIDEAIGYMMSTEKELGVLAERLDVTNDVSD